MSRAYVETRRWTDKDGKPRTAYRARYEAPNPDGRIVVRSETFRTKSAAEKRLRQVVGEIERGDYRAPSHLTLRQMIDEWLPMQRRKVRASTYATYTESLKRIPAWLLEIEIAKLTARQIERAFDEMTQAGYAPNTLRMARNPIAAALTLAVRWDIIRHNPCQQIPLPAPPKRAGIAWTTEEYRRFLAHKGAGRHPRWGIVWRFALTTGVRVGELAALAWEDVDLDAGTVTIARTVTRGADGGTVIGAFAKTSASRRVLPLDPDVIAALRPLRALPKALLFPAGDGGPLTRRTIGQALERAAAAADVPRATMHDLRRTWISRMIEAGVNPEIVATLAGHTSVVLTLDKYTRSTEQQRRDSILALRAFIADTTTSTTENPGNEASRTHGAPTTGEDAAKLA